MRTNKKGFTLIELLVVIAIIAILAAILFPVFAQVREKARVITCTSNCKQFGLAILQYAEDYDEAMPMGFAANKLNGPLTAQLTGAPQQGVYMEIMPYIKSQQAFLCPDDGGFEATGANPDTVPDAITAAGVPIAKISNQTYEQVYGSSYKFTHENFSNPFTAPFTKATSPTGYVEDLGECTTGALDPNANPPFSGLASSPTPTCATACPAVITLGFFSRPSETRMFRDFNPPYDLDDDRIWHKAGANIAYADGHAKFVVNVATYRSGCDGPTWAWDTFGSCNSMGIQRNGD